MARCLEFIAGEEIAVSDERPAYAAKLPEGRLTFERHATGGAGWGRIAAHIFRAVLFRRPDIVVSTEYRRAFLVNLALLLAFSRAPHVVLGMNLSARPITSRHRVLQRIIDRIFARSTTVVVHSTKEAELFGALHGLAAGKFAFCHWGFDIPAEDSARFDNAEKPYTCMIGRNNRDVETYAEASRLSGVRGIAVVPGYMQLAPEVEAQLEVHRDLPWLDCISCIRNAAVNVTLLRDGTRGAGHITVVTAMHLGVPQIYSETEVLREYFPDERFGVAVPIGDAKAAAEAIREAVEAGKDDDRIPTRRDFAARWLSQDHAAERLGDVLLATLEGRAVRLTTSEWDAWLDGTRTT